MLISIHIPKTAGTTIGYLLDYGMRRRVFYDYSELDSPIRKKEYDKDIALLQKHKDFIEQRFGVIHGHFYYKKYAQIFSEADYIVCLRKPISRTISQYFHIIEEADPNHWLYEDLISGKMGFVDFASLTHIKRAQSIFVEGKDIMDFKHVFLTENLQQSIYQFQLLTGFERNDPYMALQGEASIPNTNPRSARKNKLTFMTLRDMFAKFTGLNKDKKIATPKKDFKISPIEIKKATQVLAEDIDLYNRAKGKYELQDKLTQRVI